jgi:hypothetical protein
MCYRAATRISLGVAFLLIAMCVVPADGDAQSLWKKIKDQVKQAEQQQNQPKQPQPQQRQTGQAGNQGQPQPGQDAANSGPIVPPSGTKVEENVVAPIANGAKFFISPHGVHIATMENSGSRMVIYYDGVAGPKFDTILGGSGNLPAEASIVFSPDGKRYAYCGVSGDQFVVMVDGKEQGRSSETNMGRFNGHSCMLGFTSNSQHVFYSSFVVKSMSTGGHFTRFVFDGKSDPPSNPVQGSGALGDNYPAFSPDGNHYAYVAIDPADQHRWGLIVDGKLAAYKGADPQWSADSQHLYTTLTLPGPGGRGEVMQAMLDGKPFLRANHIVLHIPPAGNMVVAEVTAGGGPDGSEQFLVIGGKKVPGAEVSGYGRGPQIDMITFSPDGKHLAARITNAQSRQFVFVDGKHGQDYQYVDHLAFTADSSKIVYTASTGGNPYVIYGDEESNYCQASGTGVTSVVIAPAGNRAGAICGVNSGVPNLFMDGKTVPLPSGVQGAQDLRFTPDGQHYVYIASYRGMLRRLAIDGIAQESSNLGNVSVGTRDYTISPDSEHIAHYAFPPTDSAVYERGVFLDGKYIPSGQSPLGFKVTFTPDGKHIIWGQNVPGKDAYRVYVDGKPVVETEAAVNPANSDQVWWEMSGDGTLNFLAQDDTSLKRISITPSSSTSLESFLAGGK